MAKRKSISLRQHLVGRLLLFVLGGGIILLFLGLAALGTSYRTSISQIINARVTKVIPLCDYELPRIDPKKSTGLVYGLPCSDVKAAQRLYARGYILYRKHQQKLLLELQASPKISTSLVVQNSDIGTLDVGDLLAVRVPVLRNSESVELASGEPTSKRLSTAFIYGLIGYCLLLLIVFVFYRSIRSTVVDAYHESTKD
jgi:multisubunit Na+/H+ antiporter MnhB subunit